MNVIMRSKDQQSIPSMDTLWLGTLSLRDQGISGNFWAWTGVRSSRWWHLFSPVPVANYLAS
ncbi:uncharacterized protein N7473_011386 [Penicillium subrubescens]|uniref:uncharacterized protein n=1 Tax=Penicillium subrubescens TaxID=1316194 RepID=UPI002544DD99|nr:uncharacterized protein N7473_011386 [Penicillium subrubescens]KAJ5880333.1 hypothetical protein N7473_011386 [Penicillium subrubescens]